MRGTLCLRIWDEVTAFLFVYILVSLTCSRSKWFFKGTEISKHVVGLPYGPSCPPPSQGLAWGYGLLGWPETEGLQLRLG